MAEDEVNTLLNETGIEKIEEIHEMTEMDWRSVGMKVMPARKLVRALVGMKESE
jgi:hypothetical protein